MSGASVTWSSNNPSVALVNSTTGLVTSSFSGLATITATSGGASGTAQVVVEGFPTAGLAEAERVVTFVVAELGADDGLIAVLLAWERGYSGVQLLALGSNGLELASNGRVSQGGVAVEPEETPRGVIALPAAAAGYHGIARTVTRISAAADLANCRAYIYDEDSEGNFVDAESFFLSGGGSESALFLILLALELGIGADGLSATITGAALGKL